MSKESLAFFLNGKPVSVEIETSMMLVELLRDELGLKGVKRACDEGECGACTIIIDGLAVASCILPAERAHGTHIQTVEGLSEDDKLHPLQLAFLEEGAVQCGLCTPGMLMSAKAFLDKNPHPSREEIREAIAGNLCRCTGYKKIVTAIAKAAEVLSDPLGSSA